MEKKLYTKEERDDHLRKQLKFFGINEEEIKQQIESIHPWEKVQSFYEIEKKKEEKKKVVILPIERFAYLRTDPLKNAVRLTNNAHLNRIVGHAQLGQLINFYGRAGSGKTSLVKKILEDNQDKFKSCFISLENTQTSLDETSFNQWMYINKHYDKPYYLKDYVYAIDFANFPINTIEKHYQYVEQFIEDEKKKLGKHVQLADCTITQLISLIVKEAAQGIQLFGLDSFTLIKYDEGEQTITDQIKQAVINLKNILEEKKLILFGVCHATINDEGDRMYGSSHYNNFSDKVIEVRAPKKPNEAILRTWVEHQELYIHKELYWHKNRPYDKDFGVQYLYEKTTGNITNVELSQEKKQQSITPSKEIDVNKMFGETPS